LLVSFRQKIFFFFFFLRALKNLETWTWKTFMPPVCSLTQLQLLLPTLLYFTLLYFTLLLFFLLLFSSSLLFFFIFIFLLPSFLFFLIQVIDLYILINSIVQRGAIHALEEVPHSLFSFFFSFLFVVFFFFFYLLNNYYLDLDLEEKIRDLEENMKVIDSSLEKSFNRLNEVRDSNLLKLSFSSFSSFI